MKLHNGNIQMDRLKQGDPKAFASVFEKYHSYLYALAYRYLHSQDDAADVVQHTFMRFWELRETFSFDQEVKNLLFTIAKNHLLNEIRHRVLVDEKHREMLIDQSGYEAGLFDQIADADFREHLKEKIELLPPQKREVCLYKIVQNKSNQEVADLMGISVPTVKSHYTQAIKLLRQSVENVMVLSWLFLSV